MLVFVGHEGKLHSQLDSLVGVTRLSLLVKEIIIPVQPNAPNCKGNDFILSQPLVIGQVFNSCPGSMIVVQGKGERVQEINSEAVQSQPRPEGGSIREVEKDVVDILLVGIKEVTKGAADYPDMVQKLDRG